MTPSRPRREKTYSDEYLAALDPYSRDPDYRANRRAADPRGVKAALSRAPADLAAAARNPQYWDQAAAFGSCEARPGHLVEWMDAFKYYLDHVCIEKIDRRKKTKIAEISLDFAE